MESSESIMTVIGSGLLAAIVSAIVARFNAERNILVDNITKERKSWRENIREKSGRVFDAFYAGDVLALKKLKAEFALVLNPIDEDDIDILNHLDIMIGECVNKNDKVIGEFVAKLSLLLKHDWERAKIEANPYENVGRVADRLSFTEYVKKLSR